MFFFHLFYFSDSISDGLSPCSLMIIKPHAFVQRNEIQQFLTANDFCVLARRHAMLHPLAVFGFLHNNDLFSTLQLSTKKHIAHEMCNGKVCILSLGDIQNPSVSGTKQGLQRSINISQLISQKFTHVEDDIKHDNIPDVVYVCTNIKEMHIARNFFFLNHTFFQYETIENQRQFAFLILKPHAIKHQKSIIQLLEQFKFDIIIHKSIAKMNINICRNFFKPYFAQEYLFPSLCTHMASGEIIILIVSRDNCTNVMKQFMPDLQNAYSDDETSFVKNAIYYSKTEVDFWRDRSFFFFNSQEEIQFSDYGSIKSYSFSAARKSNSGKIPMRKVHSCEASFDKDDEKVSLNVPKVLFFNFPISCLHYIFLSMSDMYKKIK